MQNPASLAAIERETLTALQAAHQRLDQYTHTFPVGASSSGLAAWVRGYEQLMEPVKQLYAKAQWLKAQGLPNASNAVTPYWNDLVQAHAIHQQTVRNTQASEMQRMQMIRDANAYATNTILQANANRQAVFQHGLDQWFDVTENRCFDCHALINVPGGGYCWNCARRRGLVW
jgi:hypothetical protein